MPLCTTLRRQQQQRLRPLLARRQQKLTLGITEREEWAQVMLLLLLVLPEAQHSDAVATVVVVPQTP